MAVSRSLARTVAFCAVYVVATFAGRMTVMDGTNLSLVWPAAGVGVIWFCAQRDARMLWVDRAALTVVTLLVNVATGATWLAAVVFVAANLAQLEVFRRLVARWRPNLWGAGGTAGLSGPRDLWSLLAAAFVSTTAGAAIGPTGLWLLTGTYSWPSTAVWLTRNTASVLLIGAVGLRLSHRSYTGWAAGSTALRRTPGWRFAEYVALGGCSTAAYLVGFSHHEALPVDFALIAVTVWAAVRLSTTFVVLHDLAVGTIAVLFTLDRGGPFGAIATHSLRAVVAQLFVATVAVVGLVLALGRDERAALMRQLATEKQEAQRQADLLAAVVDSMAEGLLVVDTEGRILLRNQAARQLLGGHLSPGDRVADTSDCGFFRLDSTPMPTEEMAYHKALQGEDVDGEDVVVRNSGVPGGRVLRITATPLSDEQGRRSAVVVFHDVTIERRHRDELSSFAGVVAHDLLNPLTTIEGWTAATAESFDPTHPAVANLARVTRAAARMRGLINDLLSYTTARDAEVDPVPTDVTAVVEDIVAARTDSAQAAGTPVPVFLVDTPHAVRADPLLLRQLLDNLIGNAVKYTAPGVTPRIAVATARAPSATVRIPVGDNGIGIPAGEHEAIFDNFHRAHGGSGYTGTGLGLAICKRIVERHGGTIAASDNLDGGSVFEFTLPAAQRPRLARAARAVTASTTPR